MSVVKTPPLFTIHSHKYSAYPPPPLPSPIRGVVEIKR